MNDKSPKNKSIVSKKEKRNILINIKINILCRCSNKLHQSQLGDLLKHCFDVFTRCMKGNHSIKTEFSIKIVEILQVDKQSYYSNNTNQIEEMNQTN